MFFEGFGFGTGSGSGNDIAFQNLIYGIYPQIVLVLLVCYYNYTTMNKTKKIGVLLKRFHNDCLG